MKKCLQMGFVVALLSLSFFLPVEKVDAVDGEITYIGTNTNLTGDDVGAGPFNLGFTFNFYGTNFTTAYANINGTLNFSELYSRYSNVPLSTAKSGTNISDNSIYAFWDDLNTNPSGGSGNKPIYYATIGEAPNRKFVTQWTNIYFHGTTVQMGTFQIILYEGSNDVQIQYRDLLGNASEPNRERGGSATIGIRKNDSTRNQYSHDTASITQGQAIRYSPVNANSYSVNTSASYDPIYLAPEGAPVSPTLVTPSNNVTGVTLTPSFEWLPVQNATNYRILISTVSNFSSLVVDQTTANTSYTHGSDLATSTQYYWRVQSSNTQGTSLSSTRTFTTAAQSNTAPNIPGDVSSNGLLEGAKLMSLTEQSINMTLSDNDEDEQLRYRLQIASNSNFTSLVVDYRSEFAAAGPTTYTFGQTGGTYLVGSSDTQLEDGNYYVRFRAEDDSAASSSWYSSGSVAFSYEENVAPDNPSSLGESAVVTGQVITLTQPTFVFTLQDDNGDTQIQYEIEIDDSDDFSSPIISYLSALASQGARSFTVGQATAGGAYTLGSPGQELEDGAYYWRVRARDAVGVNSDYSVAHGGEVAFTVNTSVPSLDSIGVTLISSSSARIHWETSEPTSSQVEYGLVPSYGFTTAVNNTSPRITEHEVVLDSLQSCARYFYRVKSANNANTQTVSERKSFTTQGCPLSSVQEGTETTVELEGGTLELQQPAFTVRLTVPPLFGNERTHFQINLLDSETSPQPPNTFNFIDGSFFQLVAVTESGVTLETFDEPVTFSYTYSEELKFLYLSETIDVYKYYPDTQHWEKKSCSNDLSTNTLTCTLPNFSTYGVFGQPLQHRQAQSGDQSSSAKSDPRCEVSTSLSAPHLFQVKAGKNEATLYFTPSSGGATEYVIEYGQTPQANQHAIRFAYTDTGGAVPYTIRNLTQPSLWYFKVQGFKDCQSSSWSSVESVFVGERSQTVLTQATFGGQKNEASPLTEEAPSASTSEKSYVLRVKVAREEQPLQHVKVLLHDTDQEISTDEEGYAVFEQVRGGLHRLKIVDQVYAAEEEITVQGDDLQFDVFISISPEKEGSFRRSIVPVVTATLVGFSLALLFMKLRNRSGR